MLPTKWNLWNFLVDAKCLRVDCWWEDEYMIKRDWNHWIPVPLAEMWWYSAWEGITIDTKWVISIDPNNFNKNNYYTKQEIDEMLEWLDPETIREVIEKVTNIESNITTINENITNIEWDITTLQADVQELKDNDTEIVKFANITMSWSTTTVYSNSFITSDSDVILTWTSWEPAWIIETYVENWKITILSSEDESWTVRARISKPKSNWFLE